MRDHKTNTYIDNKGNIIEGPEPEQPRMADLPPGFSTDDDDHNGPSFTSIDLDNPSFTEDDANGRKTHVFAKSGGADIVEQMLKAARRYGLKFQMYFIGMGGEDAKEYTVAAPTATLALMQFADFVDIAEYIKVEGVVPYQGPYTPTMTRMIEHLNDAI